MLTVISKPPLGLSVQTTVRPSSLWKPCGSYRRSFRGLKVCQILTRCCLTQSTSEKADPITPLHHSQQLSSNTELWDSEQVHFKTAVCQWTIVNCVDCTLVAILMYVRYRQVAEYVSMPDSPHSVRLNKAALAIGLGAPFGLTLFANFPVCESLLIDFRVLR